MSKKLCYDIIGGGSPGSNHSPPRRLPPKSARGPPKTAQENYSRSPSQSKSKDSSAGQKLSFELFLDKELHKNGLRYRDRYRKRQDTLRTNKSKLLSYCFLRLARKGKLWDDCKDRLQNTMRSLNQDQWRRHIKALDEISEYSIEGMISAFSSKNGKRAFKMNDFKPYLAQMKKKKAEIQFQNSSLMPEIVPPEISMTQVQMKQFNYPDIHEEDIMAPFDN